MNIHFANVAGQPRRISTNEAKAMGLQTGGNSSMPPRNRDDLKQGPRHPHNVYPGGKKLRRALAYLDASKRHIAGMKNSAGQTIPGSMRS